MEVELRGGLAGQPKPAEVVIELPVGMDPRLDAQLGRPESDRFVDAAQELLAVDRVSVGRTAPLPEAAEGAPHGADVGDVDVAVDHERDPLAGDLLAERVSSKPDLLDHLGTALGKERGQLLRRQLLAAAGALDRACGQVGTQREGWLAATGAPTGNEAPVAGGDGVKDRGGEPVGVDVGRVDAEALRDGDALVAQLAAHLVRRRKRLLRRDVVAVGREPAEVGGPGADQLRPGAGEVWRHLDPHARKGPGRVVDQPLELLDGDSGGPVGQVGGRSVSDSGGPETPGRLIGQVGYLEPVVGVVGHEVLEDHLLDMAMATVHAGERVQGGEAVGLVLPDPDEDPAGEGNPQLPGRLDHLQADGGALGRGTLVSRQVVAQRLEHQPLRGGHLPQAQEVLAIDHADVGVREQPAPKRALAGPGHVAGEVRVAPPGEHLGDARVDLRALPGQNEELLGVPAHRLL